MRNPYEDEQDLTDYRIGRGTAIAVSALFLLTLSLPPLVTFIQKATTGQTSESPMVRLFAWKPDSGETLRAHISAVETSLDRLPYAQALRRHTQQALTSLAGEGSRKVFPGGDGWLFYRPELQALTGWGPLKEAPFSVMKDPALAKLRPARELVLEFAAQLKERGIPLLLVPVPVKPMIEQASLGVAASSAPLHHPDQLAFYEQLRAAGIDVLDLSQPLYELHQTHPAYLKQDTHWTTEGMQQAAALVGAHIREKWPALASPAAASSAMPALPRNTLGDLVQLLDLPQPERVFQLEAATLTPVEGFDPDPAAPITLLGDSFVNIYSDPALGFGDPAPVDSGSAPSLKAGFAHQLARELGQALDVIAVNGAGTTQTRKEFAARPDDVVRAKKLVVWVLAARDLLYSPAAAREANIEWSSVTFNPNHSQPKPDPGPAAPSGGKVVVEAELVAKSTNQDPNGTPYADALHTALYRVTKVLSGGFDPAANWQAVQWTFKQKQMQPTASVVPGQIYRLTLVPWDDQTALHSLNRSADKTDEDDFLAERWFVEKAEPGGQ